MGNIGAQVLSRDLRVWAHSVFFRLVKGNLPEMNDFGVCGIVVSSHCPDVHFMLKVVPLVLNLRQLLLHQLKVRSQFCQLRRVDRLNAFSAHYTSSGVGQKLRLEIFNDCFVIFDNLGQGRGPILIKLTSGDGQLVLVWIQNALETVTFLGEKSSKLLH